MALGGCSAVSVEKDAAVSPFGHFRQRRRLAIRGRAEPKRPRSQLAPYNFPPPPHPPHPPLRKMPSGSEAPNLQGRDYTEPKAACYRTPARPGYLRSWQGTGGSRARRIPESPRCWRPGPFPLRPGRRKP